MVVDVRSVDQEDVVVRESSVDLQLIGIGRVLRHLGSESGDLVDRSQNRKLLNLLLVVVCSVDRRFLDLRQAAR